MSRVALVWHRTDSSIEHVLCVTLTGCVLPWEPRAMPVYCARYLCICGDSVSPAFPACAPSQRYI